MGGKILSSPIEMAGHPYNSAVLPRSLRKAQVPIFDIFNQGKYLHPAP